MTETIARTNERDHQRLPSRVVAKSDGRQRANGARQRPDVADAGPAKDVLQKQVPQKSAPATGGCFYSALHRYWGFIHLDDVLHTLA